jgi:hypothetical protein
MNFSKGLKKLVPSNIKSKIKETLFSSMKDQYDKKSPDVYYEYAQYHIENTKILSNRNELLSMLPSYGIGAEIGVDEGEFSDLILKINQPEKLYLIDSWGSERYSVSKKDKIERIFNLLITQNKIEIVHNNSINAAHNFQNDYFDWVYIDTDHSYETTLKELYAYAIKIKPQGYICGHDYIKGNLRDAIRYGVIEAITEFCVKENWELCYLTMENQGHPSFAIKKIQ